MTTIGILDSGVGGWSVLLEIRRLLPGYPVVYIGDSAWCPYGSRPAHEIQERVFRITDTLLEEGAGLIVVACNSATIAAVEALRSSYPLPFVGMEPAVKPAAALTRSGVIGVLATEASLAGEKFHKLVSTRAAGVKVITTPCPEFVEWVEQGVLEGPGVEASAQRYVTPMVEAGADVLVLGCTHYPFLRAVIQRVAGSGVTLLDTGASVARQTARLLGLNPDALPHNGTTAAPRIITTGSKETLQRLFPVLCPGFQASLEARTIL